MPKFFILIIIFVFSCSDNNIAIPTVNSNSSSSIKISSSSTSSIFDAEIDSQVIADDIVGDSILNYFYENEISDSQVLLRAQVIKILSDDTIGDKHQRFIVELKSKQSLLVAHNIDLAPRVPNLKVNSLIYLYGEYEWNSEGGVIHWTHMDPSSKHLDGWLLYNGVKYQ